MVADQSVSFLLFSDRFLPCCPVFCMEMTRGFENFKVFIETLACYRTSEKVFGVDRRR